MQQVFAVTDETENLDSTFKRCRASMQPGHQLAAESNELRAVNCEVEQGLDDLLTGLIGRLLISANR